MALRTSCPPRVHQLSASPALQEPSLLLRCSNPRPHAPSLKPQTSCTLCTPSSWRANRVRPSPASQFPHRASLSKPRGESRSLEQDPCRLRRGPASCAGAPRVGCGQDSRGFVLAAAQGLREASTVASASEGEGEEEEDGGTLAMDPKGKAFRVVSHAFVEEIYELLVPKLRRLNKDTSYSYEPSVRVIRFLLQLWVPKSRLLQVLETCPALLTQQQGQLEEKVVYFLERGASPGEVGSGVVRRPSLLLLPVQQYDRITVYLRETGVAPERVAKTILGNPEILDLEPDNETDGLVEALASLVQEELGIVLERRPELLRLSDADVAECVDVMVQFRMTREGICNLIVKKPGVLLLSPQALRRRFQNLLRYFSPRRLPNVFKVVPSLIVLESERLEAQAAILREHLGDDVAAKVINGFPQALTLRWEQVLLPKLRYLQELGLHGSEVVNFPAYLGYSLPDRIRPRCEKLLAAGFVIAPHAEVVGGEMGMRWRKQGMTHRESLEQNGTHRIAIQHIVGLTDDDFELQFGLPVDRPRRLLSSLDEELEEMSLDELDELSDDTSGDLL